MVAAANVVSQVLLQLFFIMVLARLISKADFGVMSIALVVVGFVEIFAQIGIGPSSYSARTSSLGTSEQPCSSRWAWASRFSR